MNKLFRRFTTHSAILLYHRVCNLSSDPQMLCVSPQHFAEHMKVLKMQYEIIRLRDLQCALQNGNIPQRMITLSFDDGYNDNLYNALPLLENLKIPATVFIATNQITSGKEFWWDELDRLLLQPGELPETLELSVNGTNYSWKLGNSANYSEDVYLHHKHWNVMVENDPTPRQSLYRSLCQLLRPLSEQKRQIVLDQLLALADSNPMIRDTHRLLTPDEVIQLADKDLVEIGAHTVTHPMLSRLPRVEQKKEIQKSKAHLEEILGHSVPSFSYPYGTLNDYTAETINIVRDAGFTCACSNFPDVVWRRTDLFQLPRFVVRDWDGEEFARHLNNWIA
ncbi:MAG: polysaccharide deacetylase family protein [Bacteroidetes bacterium]|nr:polysaccharide deacetylase family protein [Bacteroidota bacterium]